MNQTTKRYLISSAITFVSMFALSIAYQLEAGALSADEFTWSAVLGVIFVALRAGVKGLVELLIPLSKR